MSEDDLDELQELFETLQITVKNNPGIEKDVNLQLEKLLYDLQNRNIASNNILYDINSSPGYKLITDRFGNISVNTLSYFALQLSSQSQIPISKEICKKPIFIFKWIDCHLRKLAPLIEHLQLPSSP